MKLVIVAIRDKQMNGYAAPMAVPTIGIAMRAFMQQCNDANTQLNKNPEDFELFHLADYDDETGKFNNLPTPKQLAIASNHIIRTQE